MSTVVQGRPFLPRFASRVRSRRCPRYTQPRGWDGDVLAVVGHGGLGLVKMVGHAGGEQPVSRTIPLQKEDSPLPGRGPLVFQHRPAHRGCWVLRGWRE
jgi:hypothetical protein